MFYCQVCGHLKRVAYDRELFFVKRNRFMDTKKFEFLDHPADVKIRSFGMDLQELFINSALGMMSFLYDIEAIKITHVDTIEVEGINLEALLINWLSEILCFSDTYHRAFVEYEIEEFSEKKIRAKVKSGEVKAKDDIKAVTYHELHIAKENGTWTAEVVYDI